MYFETGPWAATVNTRPGSFFKAHKDTHAARRWSGLSVTFDSATDLTKFGGTPALAYVAFYSDVTHAVEPVRVGYRVTLTYNLFLINQSVNASATTPGLADRIVHGPQRTFEDALLTLLADPAFLPSGGLLAYGLAHQYPMPAPPRIERLPPPKGRLQPILYDSGAGYPGITGQDVLADDVLNTEDVYEEDGGEVRAKIENAGVILQRGTARTKDVKKAARRSGMWREGKSDYHSAETVEERERRRGEGMPVHWVTRITELNRVDSYLAYGNEASIGHAYGNAALLVYVEVPAFGVGVRDAGPQA
ncbi:hypothetical protein C8R43DRAFT_1119106 [Mycena crocata]|nr:hypothetical protein C8R43DRAFT_1119106 [Mycena crocata]